MENVVVLDHVAASVNKAVNCVDIGPGDVVAYGCSNSVVLYKPTSGTDRQHLMTFNCHKGSIASVKWIRSFDSSESKNAHLISGSVDKTIICWNAENNLNSLPYLTNIATLKGHQATVTGLDGIHVKLSTNKDCAPTFLVVSTSADSTVKVWHSSTSLENLTCVQTLVFQRGFALGLALHLLPGSNIPVLACACDDFTVKLYAFCKSADPGVACHQFSCVTTLKGHEDWVRGIAFTQTGNELLLASCSQDCFIRLWKIFQVSYSHKNNDNAPLELSTKQHDFSVRSTDGQLEFTAMIDAVLAGHENWVYSVHWQSVERKGGDLQGLRLLSASMDKTVVVWQYDSDTETWIDKVRVGEVGGNTMGFHRALFNGAGDRILAHAFSGAFHAWDNVSDGKWVPAVVVSGHSSAVCDIDWEPHLGRYFLSTSEDQTTRLFAEWSSTAPASLSWHEIARPQIHGYDLQCIQMITSTKFVAGADEKVLRVFEASQNFKDNIRSLAGHSLETSVGKVPLGASVPALGLSNKAVFSADVPNEKKDEEKRKSEQYIENMFTSVVYDRPPPETHLLQNTLWPETHKLYSHVYEIFCVACNNGGTLIASAAKSSQPKHSGIVLWDVSSWQQAGVLIGHTLTVTQMAFSPNDRYLLSVSRDRTWILHSVQNAAGGISTAVVTTSDKKSCHTRVIWSCSWSGDGLYFATSSRDKKIMVWHVNEEDSVTVTRKSTNDWKESVTAVSFLEKVLIPEKYVVAIGVESGRIQLATMCEVNEFVLTNILNFTLDQSHCLPVKRLKWRPNSCVAVDKCWQLCLASCGLDNQVKLFQIRLFLC